MKTLTCCLIAAAAALSAAGPAQAQMKPEDAIKFRKSVYTVIGWSNGPIGRMIKGEIPFNRDLFARNAATIAQLSQIAPEAFPAGSDKGDTRARPEIWSDAAGFKKAMENFQAEATKLAELSRTATSLDQVRGQAAALGKACAACHDNYRTK
jgi:cytochrome c556